MNLTPSEKLRLGVFIVVGTALFCGSLLVLAGLKVWEQRDYYWVSFSESVSGLEPSSQVKYRGLRIGRIEALGVDPEDPSAIRTEISVVAGTVLYQGTEAVLEMSGITGLKIVNLTPGDPRGGRIEPGSELPAGASLVGRIGDRADAISARLEKVVNNLERWTSPRNASRVERLLDQTNALLEDLDGFVVSSKEPLVDALEELERSGAAFRTLSDEATVSLRAVRKETVLSLKSLRGTLDETQRLLASIDGDDVQGTIAAAKRAMSALDRQLAGKDLKKTFTELQTALTNITELAQDMDLTVRASREDLVLSLKYVRQATQDLREFSRIIAQDPSTLLRGTEVGN